MQRRPDRDGAEAGQVEPLGDRLLAVDPVVFIVPAVKVALLTCRSVNAAVLTATKSAGGLSTSCRMAVQSCLLQADR